MKVEKSSQSRSSLSILADLPENTVQDNAKLRELRERRLSLSEVDAFMKAIPTPSLEQLRARPNTKGEPFSLAGSGHGASPS